MDWIFSRIFPNQDIILEKNIFRGTPEQESILEWPEGLGEIDLSHCDKLTALPLTWPPGCKKIDLSWCESLTHLPHKWPEGLQEINLPGCQSLTVLPVRWPPGCKKIDLSWCESLTHLPNEWPEGIEEIDLRGCSSLVLTPQLQAQFHALEARGCVIFYPKHFLVDSQAGLLKAQMDAVTAQYLQDYPQHTNPAQLQEVLQRLLQESLGQRGGIDAILASLRPVVDCLAAHPEHIRWANDIATWSLQGCVNQPQLGWSKISAWIQIAQADSLTHKIDAAPYLLALDIIAQEVSKMRVGQSVEVEAANVLLVLVHQQLVQDGLLSTPWLGVPAGIAFAGLVAGACTTERINTITEAIEALSSAQIIKRLTETEHARIWGGISPARTSSRRLSKNISQ